MFDNLFDPNSFVVGGVTLIVMVFGITQFLKDQLHLEGNQVRWLAFGVGAFFMVVYKLVPILPEPYDTIIDIVVNSIAFALTAAGVYQYGERKAGVG